MKWTKNKLIEFILWIVALICLLTFNFSCIDNIKNAEPNYFECNSFQVSESYTNINQHPSQVAPSSLDFEIRLFFDLDSNTFNELTPLALDNIRILNESYEGNFRFHLDGLLIRLNTPTGYNVVSAKANYVKGGNLLKDLAEAMGTDEGYINVFILPDGETDSRGRFLKGFTPIYTTDHHYYELDSPKMDNIILGVDGFIDPMTLVHEIGHFFSLRHPVELGHYEKEHNGFDEDQEFCTNYMNYNCYTDHFTLEQFVIQFYFAINYRSYLIK